MVYYIRENVLFYNNHIKEAIKKLNKDNSFVVIEDKFRNSKPVLGLNHYQALLLVYTLGKIEEKDYRLPDSAHDEMALKLGILQDANQFWEFRADVVAYYYNDKDVKYLLAGEKQIKPEHYPVVIRQPSVVIDSKFGSSPEFRYIRDGRTEIIADAWWLKKTGKFSDKDWANDISLSSSGFPYNFGYGDRNLYVGDMYGSLQAVVRSATFDVYANVPPNKSYLLGGVRVLEKTVEKPV